LTGYGWAVDWRRLDGRIGMRSTEEHIRRMAGQGSALNLSEEDVTFLLTLLRNSSTPLTTDQLVEALKQRSSR
jgi:predicted transcriptional regulator